MNRIDFTVYGNSGDYAAYAEVRDGHFHVKCGCAQAETIGALSKHVEAILNFDMRYVIDPEERSALVDMINQYPLPPEFLKAKEKISSIQEEIDLLTLQEKKLKNARTKAKQAAFRALA